MIFSPFIALYIRLGGDVNLDYYLKPLISATISLSVIKILCFSVLKLYKGTRAYESNFKLYPDPRAKYALKLHRNNARTDETSRLLIVSLFVLIVQSNIFLIMKYFGLYGFTDLPKSLPIIDGVIFFVLAYLSRLGVRLVERVL